MVEFLKERRGLNPADVRKMMDGIFSDPEAEYAHVIELNAEDIYPMVATPGDPGNKGCAGFTGDSFMKTAATITAINAGIEATRKMRENSPVVGDLEFATNSITSK